MSDWLHSAWLAYALLLCGCVDKTFQCSNDAQCFSDKGTGRCESTRFCSFPDTQCSPTGWRYSANAKGALAGNCVSANAGDMGAVRPPVQWDVQTSNVDAALHGVWGDDTGTVFAVGSGGTILRSVDRGVSWPPVSSGVTADLYSMSKAANTFVVSGFISGVLQSTDGVTFTPNIFWKYLVVMHAVAGHPFGRAVVVGEYGRAFLTSDGGASWDFTGSFSGTPAVLFGGSFPSKSLYSVWIAADEYEDAYAVGESGTVGVSTSGAPLPWVKQSVVTSSNLRSVWGRNSNDVYIAGTGGAVFHSTDRGRSWDLPKQAPTTDLFSVWGQGNDVYAVGAGGAIYYSGDHGVTFAPDLSGTNNTLYGVWESADGKDVYAVGESGTIVHFAQAQ